MVTYVIYFKDSEIGHVLNMKDCKECDKIGVGFCECAADGVNMIHSLQNIGELRRALAFCGDYFGLSSVSVSRERMHDDGFIEELSSHTFRTR